MELRETSHSKFEKRNREKPPFLWATNDIDRYSMVLNSVNFYLKETTPMIVGKRLVGKGWHVPETTPNKWNKEKPHSLWVTNDIDRYSTVLNSVNFYLKETTPMIVGKRLVGKGWHVPETTPNKWNKEKPHSLWVTNDIDRYSTVLNSVNFYLKETTLVPLW